MRKLLLSLVLLPALCAPGQQTSPPSGSAGSNWQRVQALPLDTSIYVNANGHTKSCKLTSVDEGSLTCTRGKALTFQRSDVASVKLPHRGRSTLIMAGVGAGVGALTVKAAAAALFNGFFGGHAKGSVYAGGAGLGAVTFGAIGYATDLSRSTVYKAP